MAGYPARKNPINRLKFKERLGIFSLALVFSLVLFSIILFFSDTLTSLFYSFLADDKSSEVIWVENRIEDTDTDR